MKNKKMILGSILCLSLVMVGCSNENNSDSTNIESSKTENIDSNAVIYTYSIDNDVLLSKTIPTENVDINSVFKILQDEGIVKKDAKILDFKESENEFGKIGVLNLSQEYYNYNLGSTASSGMLNALAQTILANIDIDKLQILIDGQFYEDGHILLDDTFYFTKESSSEGNEDLPAH